MVQKQTDGISGFQYKKLVNKDLETYFPHISINEHLFMSFALQI